MARLYTQSEEYYKPDPTLLNVIGPVLYQAPALLTVEHLLRPLSQRVNFMQSSFPRSRHTPVSALPIFPRTVPLA